MGLTGMRTKQNGVNSTQDHKMSLSLCCCFRHFKSMLKESVHTSVTSGNVCILITKKKNFFATQIYKILVTRPKQGQGFF